MTTYAYTEVGSLQSTTLPNSVVTTYTYDALNRLDLETVKKGTDTLAAYDYALLADGQRDFVLETDDAGAVTKVDWTYDALDRLTKETYDVGNNGQAGTIDFVTDYTLDLVGNRTRKATDKPGTSFDETVTSSYNAKDQLETNASSVEGTTTYGYDANGSQIRQTRALGGTTVEDAVYRYDVRNRLAGIDNGADGTEDVRYGYDAEDVRVWQAVGADKVYRLTDRMNATGYRQTLEEKASKTAAPARAYVLGGDVVAQAAAATVGYLMYDGGGSTRAVLDATGAVAAGQVYAYDAFGNAVGFDPTAAATTARLLYRGEWFDAAMGRYDLRARLYHPAIGAFITHDSYQGGLSQPLTLHKRLYANADPVNRADPSGYFAELADLNLFADVMLISSGRTEPVNWKPFQKPVPLVLSLLPVVGSVLNAAYYIEQRRYGWAAVNAGLAIADLFALSTLFRSGVVAGSSAARVLPLRPGAPVTEAVLSAINPTRSTTNCVECAIALDRYFRTGVVQAAKNTPESLVVELEIYAGREFSSSMSEGALRQAMSNAPDGTRGIVWGSRGDSFLHPGHVFNVVKEAG